VNGNIEKPVYLTLEQLEVLTAQCTFCELHKGQINPVFARGYAEADILICGMCPGPDENKIGIPFVGTAGKILDEILNRAFSLKHKVYITNLVKCFVPAGKDLDIRWMSRCLPYFIVQLQLIKPKVIIALGKDVCNFLLNKDEQMGSMRGNAYDYLNTKLICTYHPSFLARGGGIQHKDFNKVVKDFSKALKYV